MRNYIKGNLLFIFFFILLIFIVLFLIFNSFYQRNNIKKNIDNNIYSIKLNKKKVNVGEKTSLSVYDDNNISVVDKVNYNSSDEFIAAVDDKGNITAKNPGKCFIVVSDDSREIGKIEFEVLDKNNSLENDLSNDSIFTDISSSSSDNVIDITDLSLNVSNIGLVEGDSYTLKLSILPENATNKDVIWKSYDNSIATVNNGVVTAKSAGYTKIEVSTKDGLKKAICNVYVKNNDVINVESIKLNKNSSILKIGESIKLSVNILPENATNKDVIWKSYDNSIATVNNGVVTAKSAGYTKIEVSTKDGLKKAICNIYVKKNDIVNVESIKLNKNSSILKIGETIKLSVNILPENATNNDVIWKSYDNSIATVNNGVVTAKSAGNTKIEVSTKDGLKDICNVTIIEDKIIDGWNTINNKKYYYKDGKKVTNQFIDYIYLGNDGAAYNKIGSFDVTLYKSTGWIAVGNVNVRQSASSKSKLLGSISVGSKVTVLSDEDSGYIKVQYGNLSGYILVSHLFINLPDIMPNMYYDIKYAYSTGAIAGGMSIPNVTGRKLYKFSKKYNSKIGRNEWYVPLLYSTAKKLQNANRLAVKDGYNFKIFDTYRPRVVEEYITKNYLELYNKNSNVKKWVNYDKEGNYWGPGWFMTTTGTSKHCQGIAIDLGITDKNGKDLKAQTEYDVLDTHALRKYNNKNANLLSKYMTNAEFSTLSSEWWHFDERQNKNVNYNPYETFYIYD